MGQQRLGRHVPDGVNPRLAGLKLLADLQPAVLHLQGHILPQKPGEIRLTPDGHQHLCAAHGNTLLVGRHRAAQGTVLLGDLRHRGIAVHGNPLPLQLLLQPLPHHVVHRSHEMPSLLHNGHMGTEVIENGRELHRDHAAAHDYQPVKIPALRGQQPVAVPHPRQVRARDMIHNRHSARCDNHRLPLKILLASTAEIHLHGLIPTKQRGAINHIHVQLLKLALDALPVTLHRRLFILLHFPEIKGNEIRGHSELITVLHHMEHIGGVQQRLCGNAPPVHAGSAELLSLDHHRFQAELRRLHGRRITARASPYNHNIVMFCHYFPSPSSNKPSATHAFQTPSSPMSAVT